VVGGGPRRTWRGAAKIDMSKPVTLAAYGSTREGGLYELSNGNIEGARIRGRVVQHTATRREADTYLSRARPSSSSRTFACRVLVSRIRKISDANPQQDGIQLGHRILSTSRIMTATVQGILALPDD